MNDIELAAIRARDAKVDELWLSENIMPTMTASHASKDRRALLRYVDELREDRNHEKKACACEFDESQPVVWCKFHSDMRKELDNYELLKRGINESGDCLPTCDSNAHDEQCPNVNMHVVIQDQQREIEQLRALCNEQQAKLTERLVKYCVCTGQSSPIAGCDCVFCTTSRLEAENSALKDEVSDLIAGKEYQAMQRTLSEVNVRLMEKEIELADALTQLADCRDDLRRADELGR